MSESPLCPVCHRSFRSTDGFVYLGAVRVLLHPACYSDARWRASKGDGKDAVIASIRKSARRTACSGASA